MEITQIKNPLPRKFKRLSFFSLIIIILTFPILIWYLLYICCKNFYVMPRFTNTFHRFGKYDPLYHGIEKYSLAVLTTDSIIKNNSLIAFSTKEKNNLKFQEHEIINGNTILSSLILINPNNKNNKWIIAMHGWTENKFLALRMTRHFYNEGYNIVSFDARNHGKSSTKTIGFGFFEKHDLAMVIKYLHKNFIVQSIGLIGNSMGGSTIIEFIKEYSEKIKELKVSWAISDCAYSSFIEQLRWMSMTIFKKHWFWTISVMRLSLRLVNELKVKKLVPKNNLKKCATIPLLIIHGEKDNFVPLHMAYDIYHHKIRDEEKQISELLIIKDAGHVQSITTDYDLYTSKTLLFAKTHEEITN